MMQMGLASIKNVTNTRNNQGVIDNANHNTILKKVFRYFNHFGWGFSYV